MDKFTLSSATNTLKRPKPLLMSFSFLHPTQLLHLCPGLMTGHQELLLFISLWAFRLYCSYLLWFGHFQTLPSFSSRVKVWSCHISATARDFGCYLHIRPDPYPENWSFNPQGVSSLFFNPSTFCAFCNSIFG